MGQAPVTSNNLKELFRYRSISTLFDMDIPKQVACDLKVAAMMVGIKMASSKYPCPFCLFTKGAVCTGIPPKPRRWEDHKLDLQLSRHSVISEPVIRWTDSPMEVFSISPLHLLLGITNKLYEEARPVSGTEEGPRSLSARHSRALVKYNIRRSAYFEGTLEGDSCSRLLDSVYESKIPFGSSSKLVLDALKAFKIVKDKCFGLTREEGWKEAITAFREAWVKTGLSWTLKAHIVCDHTQEFLEKFEPVAGAGLSLSSEQSGEALHARLQRVWNLRFRINPDNEQYGQRLVDCMVAYNWNLQWDEAARFKARANSTASHPYDDSSSSSSSSGGVE